MTPYTLPDGNVQIAFSGGRTSAYMLHQILEANGSLPTGTVAIFTNTGREMPETLDFIQECGSRWGIPIVWLEYAPRRAITDEELSLVAKIFGPEYAARLADWWRPTKSGFRVVSHNSAARHGEPFMALVLSRKFLPNQNARFCTAELKVRTAKRYIRSVLGWDHWTNAIGIRADEAHRSVKPPKDRWTNWRPLVEAKVSKRNVASFWRSQPFDLRLPNVKGNCWLGNCDGCFLKAESSVAALHRDFSERGLWWEHLEAWMAEYWPSLSPAQRLRRILTAEPEFGAKLREAYGRPIRPSVIRSIVNNPRSAAQFSKRYSRADLRNTIERQGDWIFNVEGYHCQVDGGECMG